MNEGRPVPLAILLTLLADEMRGRIVSSVDFFYQTVPEGITYSSTNCFHWFFVGICWYADQLYNYRSGALGSIKEIPPVHKKGCRDHQTWTGRSQPVGTSRTERPISLLDLAAQLCASDATTKRTALNSKLALEPKPLLRSLHHQVSPQPQ